MQSPNGESVPAPFYARLGVPEVWIIDRDTKAPEIHALTGDAYEKRKSGPGGWARSEVTGVELRRTAASKLALRVAGDDSTLEELPE